MSFKWQPQYSVGITEIDNQHQKLFAIGEQIYELLLLNDGVDRYDDIMNLLNELRDYAVYHFDYEEKLMAKCDYERLGTHRMEHQLFTQKVARFGNKDVDSEQEKAIMELLNFIAEWISGHILNTDHKYTATLKAHGIN